MQASVALDSSETMAAAKETASLQMSEKDLIKIVTVSSIGAFLEWYGE